MRDLVAISKALADETRLRALLALRGRELCLCQLIKLLRLSPSTVSKHMAILNQAGLVESRKKGRWVHYRLPGRGAHPCVVGAIRWLKGCLARDPQVRADKKRLRVVCRLPKKTLSACYKR